MGDGRGIGVREMVGQALERLGRAEAGLLAARLTLLYLLVAPFDRWYLLAPTVLACCWGLLDERAARSAWLWAVLAVVTGGRVLAFWWLVDNHAFLLFYWSLALLLWSAGVGSAGGLRTNARLLVGLVFLFATASKLLSPDFADGTFLRAALLGDGHFHELSVRVGGQPEAAYQENVRRMRELHRGTVERVAVSEPRSQVMLARVGSWWTVAIEALVAITFLVPAGWRLARSRHLWLLIFCWTTYPVATVETFGWLLLILGIAQSERRRGALRMAYLGTAVLLLLFAAVPR